MTKETTETSVALIKYNIGEINKKLVKVDRNIEKLAEDREEIKQLDLRLTMIEKIVYGLVAIVLTTVMGAILTLVIIRK